MRVESFKIRDFRSITTAEVPIADLTCLVGGNNEGKSNILRAIVIGMTQLLGYQGRMGREPRRYTGFVERFDEERDLPIGTENPKPSVEVLLRLDEKECEDFHAEFGHRINGELRFRVRLNAAHSERVKVIKQKSGSQLTAKSAEIAAFVRQRLTLEYIPAVRTAEHAFDVVRRLTADQLRVLRRNDEYRELTERLRELERPVLTAIEDDLFESLSEFLPKVKSVSIDRRVVPSRAPHHTGALDLTIDDGEKTYLSAKGDGVQSLAAIAVAKRAAANRGSEGAHLLLAIEEPETHLHPAAIRRLRGVLREMSRDQQILLTTHSPLLIDTEKPSRNVVVSANRAQPADSVEQIRSCLGVEIADNLRSARLVVLVEGSSDVAALTALLSGESQSLGARLSSGELRLESLRGASRLSAHASSMRASACSVYAVLDGDDAGVAAVKKAQQDGRLASTDYMLVHRSNLDEAELEDLYQPRLTKDAVSAQFGVDIRVRVLGGKGDPWSTKVTNLLKKSGKAATSEEMQGLKVYLANHVAELGVAALSQGGKDWIAQLASLLEQRLN